MKNFMVVVLMALLSGCSGLATRDPVAQAGQVAGGAVAGGVVGDWIYRNIGRKGGTNPWPSRVIGAILGGGAVSSAQDQSRCKQYGECGGVSGGGQSVMPRRSSGCYGLPPNEPGKTYVPDPYQGRCNYTTAEELSSHPFYAPRPNEGWSGGCWGSYDGCWQQYSVAHKAFLARQEGGAMSERADVQPSAQPQYAQSNRGQQDENVLGLTVENYRDTQSVHPRCKTGNYGHDAICLKEEAVNLDERQTACENGTGPCRQQYSSIAGAYRDLASNLTREQRQLNSGRW